MRPRARPFVWRVPLRPAAPLTPALQAMRPQAMAWCGLGIIMLLTSMMMRGRPMLAVMTALVVLRAVWLLVRFIRAQIHNDLDFWTAERIRAWDAGECCMARLAAISEAPSEATLTPPAPHAPIAPARPAPTAPCCSAADHDERSVA